MLLFSKPSRIQRVRYDLRQREVHVSRVETLGENFVSITFAGDALGDFTSQSFDDHIKFIFATTDGETVRRDYTPRHFDAARRELTIEFAQHGGGKASEWARRAVVGDRAVIGGPKGSMIIPLDYAWHVLVGDATALPAIHRRLEELPAGARAFALVQIGSPADRRPIDSAAQVELSWVDSGDALVAALRALPLPPGEGFVWCAGEASTMVSLREILRTEKSQPKEAMRVSAYWKRGASDFHEKLD